MHNSAERAFSRRVDACLFDDCASTNGTDSKKPHRVDTVGFDF